ncbi:MAG: hypothetical protein ACJAXS_001141 [Colwellia sp.]|jgi:hypothetical protein
MAQLQRLGFWILFITLSGCGGSGDGGLSRVEAPAEGGSVVSTLSLNISDTTVTGAAPVIVTATVMQGTLPVTNRAVTFTTNLGVFSPSSGSALTNDNGEATITLTAGSVRGAGEISAYLSSGEKSSVPLGFKTQGDDIGVVGDININVTLIDGEGASTDRVTSSKPARVIATIDGTSAPLIVTFSSTVGDIPIPSAITNADNQAIVDLYAGENLGAGTITASITSGESGQTIFVVGSSTVIMGTGSPFVEGAADISLDTISAGGTTVVSVIIIDDQGNNFAEPVDIEFSSSCTRQTIPTATISSPVTTSNGVATSTYLAKGCLGEDQINVTANAGGINLSANGIVTVLPADAGSIEFVSATPEYISIIGTGSTERPESSTIIFRVLDTNGNPINNSDVDFSLNTDVGGMNVIPTSATTDNNGLVQTVVNSGSVSHAVVVTASIRDTNPLISTQSSNLIVSTGIPDQDSFTLGADILNPEAWNLTGTEVIVTARLADAFNNPPPPTVVYFTTEGGSIGNSSAEKQCTTDDSGACFVIWRSQNPRPEGHILGDLNNPLHAPENINTMGQRYGGRATVLATTIGEESFPDLNGNGRFDVCEVKAFNGGTGKPCNADGSINEAGADIIYSGNDVSGQPYDLPEAFSDYNEDQVFNPSDGSGDIGGELEEPSDFNANGLYDGKDGLYNGVLCAIPNHAGCAAQKSLDVRGQLVLVMSGSNPRVCIATTSDNSSTIVDFLRVDEGTSGDIRVKTEFNSDLVQTPKVADEDAIIIARKNGLCSANVVSIEISNDWDNDSGTTDTLETHNYIDSRYDNTVHIKGENTGSVSVTISDLHNQPMPVGTTIKFTATAGTIVGPSDFTWPNDNNNGGATYAVSIKGEKEAKAGVLIMEVTTPNGLTTFFSETKIDIQ